MAVAIEPRATNEEASSAVAVLLCRMSVAPRPARNRPVARAEADPMPEARPEGARHAGADHAQAPDEERDGA
jgi:hypothetical protein